MDLVMTKSNMRRTISQIQTQDSLRINDIFGSAHQDIDELLCFALRKSPEFLYQEPNYTLSFFQTLRYQHALAKRIKNIPLQYIKHQATFYDNTFFVSPWVLIPREDSRILVDQVRKYCEQNNIQTTIEIGSGSGALSITLKKQLPHLNCVALDISCKALIVSMLNAYLQKVKVAFHLSNLLSKYPSKPLTPQPYIIFSNPPYLTSEEMNEPSIQKEPALALYGGDKGIEMYEKICEEIKKLPHAPEAIFFEIGSTQGEIVSKIVRNNFPSAQINISQDASNRDRVLTVVLSQEK